MEGYKWLSCLFVFGVLPGIVLSTKFNGRFGNGKGAVFGNIMTALFITMLILVAFYADANKSTFVLFLAVFFFGFPFTVCSQLTTAPMLDTISPPERRGEIQGSLNDGEYDLVATLLFYFDILRALHMLLALLGYNTMVMEVAGAITPVILGEMEAVTSTEFIMWSCVVTSIIACFVNMPLAINPLFGAIERRKAISHLSVPTHRMSGPVL